MQSEYGRFSAEHYLFHMHDSVSAHVPNDVFKWKCEEISNSNICLVKQTFLVTRYLLCLYFHLFVA